MAILDSKFDILRGWPNSSAVAEEFKLAATHATNPQTAGKWVPLANGMKVADAAGVSGGVTAQCGLIIEGREDESHKLSGTCTVLLGGGYIVRLSNAAGDGSMFTWDAGLVAGIPVKVEGSIIVKAVAADDDGQLPALDGNAADPGPVAQANTNKIVGFVVDGSAVGNAANSGGYIDVYIR